MSTDDGPIFMSDIVEDLRKLYERQKVVEQKLAQYASEHNRVQIKIAALSATLEQMEKTAKEDSIKEAAEEGEKKGQEKTMNLVKTVLLPILIGFLSWFLPATLEAIKHSIVDETLHPSEKEAGPPEVLPPNGTNRK
jgi:hypothetical protein